jgi:hypothetical protein
MTENEKEVTAEIKTPKLVKASADYSIMWPSTNIGTTPWSPSEVDKLEFVDHADWTNIVADCRYYYKRDPFAATVINKIVDLAINDIVIHAGGARDSIVKIVDGFKNPLLLFLRNAALEYLTTGLVVPEISFDAVPRNDLHKLGITRFSNLILPVDMWIRDAATIIVKDPMFGGRKSYFMEIPKELIYFIKNEGKYEDQSEDKELYEKMKEENPEIVAAVLAGEKKVLLDNPFVIQYRTLANEAYPTPYLFPALESLKHKRNMKRMDYSIASRVITAIQLIKMGSDEFPLTEDNEDQLDELKKEMKWRESQTDKNIERIFQLFGNHTLSIEWIFPDIDLLLDDTKYRSVNQDIAVALGFPRILVTGETERTQTSDPEIATISPLNTMERIRESIFPIIARIIDTIVNENNLGGQPEVAFKPINLMAMSDFVDGIKELYLSGNLSRESFDAVFGFDLFEELHKRAEEKELMKELGVEEFAPVPFSEEPVGNTTTPKKPAKKKPAPKKKPNA